MEVVTDICDALVKHSSDDRTYIQFTQIVIDAETYVKIFTKPKDGKYTIFVGNNRTDTLMFSTPITEVFTGRLPKLFGYLEVSKEDLIDVLTNLIWAKTYFGISVSANHASQTLFYKHLVFNKSS
jgi:hypothetical protein